MSILNENIEPTQEEMLQGVARNIIGATQRSYQNLVLSHQRLYTAVWENPKGFTAQQVMDTLGTTASDLISLEQATLSFLETVNPGSTASLKKTDPADITVNEDGTVTVN